MWFLGLYMGGGGYVNLSTRMSTNVYEICQNIQLLVPGGNHSLNQIPLSLSLNRKTGSKNIFNDLHDLGHGIPYTDTLFIMDKWAERCVKQQSLVPSTIRKGKCRNSITGILIHYPSHGDQTL